jgi:hypothetical protein
MQHAALPDLASGDADYDIRKKAVKIWTRQLNRASAKDECKNILSELLE